MLLRLSVIAMAFVCVAGTAALACTGIRLTARDGAVVVARTLEFGMDLESKIVVIPAGTNVIGTLPNGASGIAFATKYGIVGANAFGLPVVLDGLNDRGLYVGEFFFPGYAGYADVTPADASRAMAGYQYSEWILGNFASVAEVKAAYDRVLLAPTVLSQMGMAPPIHFRIVQQNRRVARHRTNRRKAAPLRRSARHSHQRADLRLALDQPEQLRRAYADDPLQRQPERLYGSRVRTGLRFLRPAGRLHAAVAFRPSRCLSADRRAQRDRGRRRLPSLPHLEQLRRPGRRRPGHRAGQDS